LCQATREYVTVALGGDGADELFFGYPNFKLLWVAKLMAALPAGVGTALGALANSLPAASGYMNRAFLLRQFAYGIGKPARQQSIYWMAAVPPREQESLWQDGAGIAAAVAAAVAKQLPADSGLSLKESCQYQFINSYLAGDILQKMDRAAMNVSLEVRSPYLSSAVADFALSLPVRAHHRGATGKRILKQVASRYLPQRTITRRKHGFALPVSAMLRTDLREVAESTLLDRSNTLYECLRFEAVRSRWDQHMAGQRDHGKALLALLMLAAFYRNQF
jgi:asparagine synthase (glutamine-hydrolysing)